ncbi:hypothetical protein M569_13489, partial [Genlisea aurea]
RIFDELPKATIAAVSLPDASDISPLLLSYTIELQYKQYKWQVCKKASQVIYLHLALKKRSFVEEFHEKQEQIKEWLHNIGLRDHATVVHDEEDPDDGALPLYNEVSVKSRYVPSRAALPIIRPAIGDPQTIMDMAKIAMQGYLNHFLGNLDIVNSSEVCRFLEVSKLSFKQEYGPKLKEGYVMVQHLPMFSKDKTCAFCCSGNFFGCCRKNWQKVWLVLKPGFLAFVEHHFEPRLLDIVVFDGLRSSKDAEVSLAKELKQRNLLRHAFEVSHGNQSIKVRTTSQAKVQSWVSAINAIGMKGSESWCNPHRFNSFAPIRGLAEDGSQAQWFVDGKAAFEAIATSIENANSEIFITGWWICPELYLRRPFHIHSSSRLDALLEAKAKLGVQIFILLYKEVSIALKINSLYSKRKLLSIHENVKVLRYPNHLSSGIYLWSHHEKLVIVDQKICFIGGLDLCYGRYDTSKHEIGDFPASIWPGKDYYNPRESEPNSWEDAEKDELDRKKNPRMPWHDVHCAIWGPSCRDISRHFVQRWNHAKRSKARSEQKIPLLMPQHHMVLPHYLGRSEAMNIEKEISERNSNEISLKTPFSPGSPPEDIPLLLPYDANDPDVSILENKSSSFTSAEYNTAAMRESFGSEMDFQVESCSWQTQEHIFPACSSTEESQVGPRCSCSCQVVRSVSQWSAGTSYTEDSIHKAYCTLVEEAEYFIYIENQFFISGLSEDDVIQNRVLESLYNRIMRAYSEKKCFRVIIVIPLLPGFKGSVHDSGAATVRALMHWQYRTICKGESSILQKLFSMLGPVARDFISFFGLRTHGRLSENGSVVTSQIYVHSKVMIVDDRIALIGSSNINDRSLLGSRDSEIAVLIEDKEFIDSSMAGNPWKAGRFAFSLRLSLWTEHLGLRTEEASRIHDPVSRTAYHECMLGTAESNTKIYQDVFCCIPNDNICSRQALKQSRSHWKQKLPHTTIDLGVSPNEIEVDENGEVFVVDPMHRLKSIRGHLVSFPLKFMSEEDDLRPMFIEGEFYTSSQVFH